jgi:hypothetical protein
VDNPIIWCFVQTFNKQRKKADFDEVTLMEKVAEGGARGCQTALYTFYQQNNHDPPHKEYTEIFSPWQGKNSFKSLKIPKNPDFQLFVFMNENPYIETLHQESFTIKDCGRQSFFHFVEYPYRSSSDETHVSAQQPEAEKQTRVPGKNEVEGRQESSRPAPGEGKKEADRQR